MQRSARAIAILAAATAASAGGAWAQERPQAESRTSATAVTELVGAFLRDPAANQQRLADLLGATNTAPTPADKADRLLNTAMRRFVERAVADPLTAGSQAGQQQQVTFLAEHGDAVGRARITFPIEDSKASLQLTVSAPIATKTLVTRAGLAKNASFEGAFNYTWFQATRKVPPTPGEAAVGAASPMLVQAATRQYPGVSAASALPALLETLREVASRTGTGSAVATALAGPAPDLSILFSSPTLVGSQERFFAAYAQLPPLVRYDWSGQLSAAYVSTHNSIDYLTKEALASATYDHTTSGVQIGLGISRMAAWHPGNDPAKEFLTPSFYAGVSIRAVGAVSADDPRHVCTPVAGVAGASECFDLPVGEPVLDSDASSVTIELRKWALNQSIGLNPKYSWARANDKTTEIFQLPIYLLHQSKDGVHPEIAFGADLSGGVNIAYQRKTANGKGLSVSVFITKAFGIPD